MIVWITHVKVGYRQTPHKQNSPPEMVGRFAFFYINFYRKRALKFNSARRIWLKYLIILAFCM